VQLYRLFKEDRLSDGAPIGQLVLTRQKCQIILYWFTEPVLIEPPAVMAWVEHADWTTSLPAGVGGRTFHSCTYVPHLQQAFLIGGTDGQKLFGDVHVLSFLPKPGAEVLEWAQMDIQSSGSRNSFSPRSRHSAVHVDGKIYVFGGIGGGDPLFAMNIAKRRWMRLKTTGQGPCSRFAHIAIAQGGGSILVAGGHSGRAFLDDVFRFCTIARRWFKIPIRSDAQLPKSLYYTGCRVGSEVALFGGVPAGDRLDHMWVLKRPSGKSHTPNDAACKLYHWQKVALFGVGGGGMPDSGEDSEDEGKEQTPWDAADALLRKQQLQRELELQQHRLPESPLSTLSSTCFACDVSVGQRGLGNGFQRIYLVGGSLGMAALRGGHDTTSFVPTSSSSSAAAAKRFTKRGGVERGCADRLTGTGDIGGCVCPSSTDQCQGPFRLCLFGLASS